MIRTIILAAGTAGACTAPPADFEGTINTGAELFVRAGGAGEPVIVVHGGPAMPHTYLLPGMNELRQTHRVVFYDQRGSGGSIMPLDSSTISLDLFVQDIDVLTDSLGFDRFHLLGHSFGAYLAVVYAVSHQDRLLTLTLANPTEPGHRHDSLVAAHGAARQTDADREAMNTLRTSDGFANREPETIAEMFRTSFLPGFHDRDRIDELRLEFAPHDVDAVFGVAPLLFPTGRRGDYWDDLAGVTVPVLVIGGSADVVPPDLVHTLAEAFPNGESVILDDSGHFPYLETPAAFFDAVRTHLARR